MDNALLNKSGINPLDAAILHHEHPAQKGYEKIISELTQSPTEFNSLNNKWFEKSNLMITDYKTFPTIIFDKEIEERANN